MVEDLVSSSFYRDMVIYLLGTMLAFVAGLFGVLVNQYGEEKVIGAQSQFYCLDFWGDRMR